MPYNLSLDGPMTLSEAMVTATYARLFAYGALAKGQSIEKFFAEGGFKEWPQELQNSLKTHAIRHNEFWAEWAESKAMLMAVKDMGIPMERYCVSTVIVVSPVLVDAVVLDMGEGEPPYDPSVSWPGDGTAGGAVSTLGIIAEVTACSEYLTQRNNGKETLPVYGDKEELEAIEKTPILSSGQTDILLALGRLCHKANICFWAPERLETEVNNTIRLQE